MKKISLLITVMLLLGCNAQSDIVGDYYDNRDKHNFTFKTNEQVVLVGVSEASIPYSRNGNVITIVSKQLFAPMVITVQDNGSLEAQGQVFVKK